MPLPVARLQCQLDSPAPPSVQMARDLELARIVFQQGDPPALRIYRWSAPAVTIARHQKVEQLPDDLRQSGYPIAVRPTGGGAVLHNTQELTYALVLHQSGFPVGVPARNLAIQLHEILRTYLQVDAALGSGHLALWEQVRPGPSAVCFEHPVFGDLMFNGKKVGGAALRFWKKGLLLQGSLKGLPVSYDDLANYLTEAVGMFVST